MLGGVPPPPPPFPLFTVTVPVARVGDVAFVDGLVASA